MQARYWTIQDKFGLMVQHIILEHVLIAEEDRNLCDARPTKDTRVVIKRNPKVEICHDCKEKFIKSDHPEAIAYRSMFA